MNRNALFRRGERLKRLAYDLMDLAAGARLHLGDSEADSLHDARRGVNAVAEAYLKAAESDNG